MFIVPIPPTSRLIAATAPGEKKPIRITMQDGRNDNRGVRDGGAYDLRDWFLQNVRFKGALVEKGYDLSYQCGIGRHSQQHGGMVLPDMMRWLWGDRPLSTDVKDMIGRSFNTPAKRP